VHEYESSRPFDLVICHDVLQYLDARDAAGAIRNLGRLCRGVLHFSVLTSEDWERHCDRNATDRNAHLRPAEWYGVAWRSTSSTRDPACSCGAGRPSSSGNWTGWSPGAAPAGLTPRPHPPACTMRVSCQVPRSPQMRPSA